MLNGLINNIKSPLMLRTIHSCSTFCARGQRRYDIYTADISLAYTNGTTKRLLVEGDPKGIRTSETLRNIEIFSQ